MRAAGLCAAVLRGREAAAPETPPSDGAGSPPGRIVFTWKEGTTTPGCVGNLARTAETLCTQLKLRNYTAPAPQHRSRILAA